MDGRVGGRDRVYCARKSRLEVLVEDDGLAGEHSGHFRDHGSLQGGANAMSTGGSGGVCRGM